MVMTYRTASRLVPIVLLLFPGLWGVFSLINNVSGFAGTAEFAVKPMLAMTDTYGNPAQTWRAITAPWVAPVALVAITATETLAGVLSIWGVLALMRRLGAPADDWNAAKVPGILGCLAAVLVWGLGFMVIGGDWFLSWQGAGGIDGQLGGMIYTLPAMVALVVLLRRED
jgi:predicted small integral membrane protein